MKGNFALKYARILEILPSVAECTGGRLVLVGGTALAIFHLKHRLSVDLDFATLGSDDVQAKEALKGCLSAKGVRAFRSRFSNQFVIHFEDTSIKVEVLPPSFKVNKAEWHEVGGSGLLVASLEDILRMKEGAYAERKEARDLFDVMLILKSTGEPLLRMRSMIKKNGAPKNMERLQAMVFSKADFEEFEGEVSDASKTSN
ncbi:TPA: nucleotidyl transferase AbiEii/AbiGii toxin family protein [Candidatus Micrarchaeota archaeon]|nr:nucleotidyl transferase AbiEii/AbiGii toxin family protein [Candidatus Micrarchaeota archaeon]